jgi:phosphatidate cytidylyltransferase
MNNTVQRLLLFFIAIPSIAAIVLFLPFWNHAAISAVIVLASAGSAYELATILQVKGFPARKRMSALSGGIIPFVFYVSTWIHHINLPGRTILMGTACLLIFLLAPFAFARTDAINRLVPEVLALVFAILYPGLLAGYMILIASGLAHSTEALVTFAAMTLGNDSLAWLFGMSLGRRRNIVAVSPNKSAAGFVGGMLGSVALAFACSALFPEHFRLNPLLLALMGLVVGFATIVGDLFESALKRSAGVKDSGHMIPGRGGFLDSIDSLLFAAPVFFAFCLAFGLFT